MHSLAEDGEHALEVLTEMGVTDAELRRLYGCDPEADLATAVRNEIGDDRTTALLRALEATDRSFELGARVTEDVSDPLARVLDRYGYSVEVSADGHELDVVAFDAVTNDIHRFRTIAESDPFQETLESALLHPVGLTTVDLVDGSILVADRGAIARLQARYGERIAPFGEPILRSAVDVPGADTDGSDAAGNGTEPDAEPTVADAAAQSDVDERNRVDDPASDNGGDALSDAFENGKALAQRGEEPETAETTTSEAAETTETAAVAETTETAAAAELDDVEVGGGPRTSVSEGSIDDIFDDLETETRSSGAASLAGGGPKKTVSSRSTDEIIDQARGDTSFDELAAREAEADPDAILDEDDDVFVEESQTETDEGTS